MWNYKEEIDQRKWRKCRVLLKKVSGLEGRMKVLCLLVLEMVPLLKSESVGIKAFGKWNWAHVKNRSA